MKINEKKQTDIGPEEPYSNWRSIIDKPKYLKNINNVEQLKYSNRKKNDRLSNNYSSCGTRRNIPINNAIGSFFQVISLDKL